MTVGDWILTAAAAVAAVPWLVLAAEAFASVLPGRRPAPCPADRPPCGVLVPAHNEAAGIAGTVRNVAAQLRPGDVLLVVADNCTDDTATVAREAGATVAERHDADRRGKGYALDHGLKNLPADLPVVVVVDADCELESEAIDRLVDAAHRTQRPVQGVYLIGTGRESDPKRQLSAFAVLLKNKIRPLGLHRAGLPCLLTGTGMAFPRAALDTVSIGSGNIVEDMRLGVDLALASFPARLVPDVRLRGAAAPDKASALTQRTRWEHGHVATLLHGTPRLLLAGLVRAKPRLIALGLELGVPPLSLLALSAVGLFIGCVLWWQLNGSFVPTLVIGAAVVSATTSVFVAWLVHGRSTVPLRTLILLPGYVAWKIPIYLKMLARRQKTWVRTERSAEQNGIRA